MKRIHYSAVIAKAIYDYHDEGGCVDGPRCVWCPTDRVLNALIDAGYIAVDDTPAPAPLADRVRDVLSNHGLATFPDDDPVVIDLLNLIGVAR